MIEILDRVLLELPPGIFVPAGLPLRTAIPSTQPLAGAVETFGHVLAAAADARARLAWGRAETHAREAAELAPRAGVPHLAAAALNELSAIHLSQGIVAGVPELCARAIARAAAGPEAVRAHLNLAVAAGLQRAPDEAFDRLETAESLLKAEDRWGSQLLRLNRAATLVLAGDLDEAQQAAAEALRAGRREKEEVWAGLASLAAACAHRARGTRNAARSRLAEAVRAFVRAGDRLRVIQCHYLLGELAYEAEDPIRAGSHYRDGLAVAREAGYTSAIELLTLRFEHR